MTNKKRCIHYQDFGECLCNNDPDDPGECVYEDGIEKSYNAIQCKHYEIKKGPVQMNEQNCRTLIKSDLQGVAACCKMVFNGIEEFDLNTIDGYIDSMAKHLETAKKRLKDCENY